MNYERLHDAALQGAPRKKRSIRYIVSRILLRTGICRLLTFESHGYRLRFFPTDLSAELWNDPTGRHRDIDFLRSYLKAGEMFVDVGANVGSTVLAGASAVGSAGHVVAFEPHPQVFRHLVQNIQLNGVTTVTPHNVALGAIAGVAAFSDYRSDDQNHILPNSSPGIDVSVASLDSFMSTNDEIALIKVDVEGYESKVLSGAGSSLAKTRGIYIEVADGNLRTYGASADEVIGALREAGFSILRWRDNTLIELGPEIQPPFDHHENVVGVKSVEELEQRLGNRFSVHRT